METRLIKKYRVYLIVIAVFLVVISGYFIKDTFSYLTQKIEQTFDAQIGRMEIEILLNGNSPTKWAKTKWTEVPIAVKLIGGTKIAEDKKFNEAVMPSTISLKNVDTIPFNMSFKLALPEMSDNGFLYMVLPYNLAYPTDKDYKSFIFQGAGFSVGATPTYEELKTKLKAYNDTSLATYKSTITGGKFTADSKIYRLDSKDSANSSSQINILFWAEYDKLNADQRYENTLDYRQLGLNFSLEIAVRQVQDDIFSNVSSGGGR